MSTYTPKDPDEEDGAEEFSEEESPTSNALSDHLKGTDELDDKEEEEMLNRQGIPEEFIPGYRMNGVPTTIKELLQHYHALALSETKVAAVYLAGIKGAAKYYGGPLDLEQVVGQEEPHRWNTDLLPSIVEDICMNMGEVQITLTKPVDVTAEKDHWTSKNYAVLETGNMIYIMKGTTTFRIEDQTKLFIEQDDVQKYLKNMREI